MNVRRSTPIFLGLLGLGLGCSAELRSPTAADTAPPTRTAATVPEPPRPLRTGPKFTPQSGKEYLDNSIGMNFVQVPAGKFQMGSPRTEAERRGDEVRHEVEITRPFWLGVCEVTQDEYAQVMGGNPSHFSPHGDGRHLVRDFDTRRFPVENVTWNDAQEFCRKLSAREREKAAGRKYRLPTEAEWEYACRGGGEPNAVFATGAALTSDRSNFDGGEPYPEDARKGPNLQRPTFVGSYPPNGFGLHDMHGNVGEWCDDGYSDYYTDASKDPVGPAKGDRVVRGGSWYNPAAACRSAARWPRGPAERFLSHTIGFRVVCVRSE